MKKKSCEDRRLVKNPPRTKKFRRQRRIDAARSKKYFLLHLGIPKSKSHNYSRKRNRKMKNFGNFRESDPQVKNYRCDPSKRYSQKKTRRPPVASSKSKRGVSQRHVKMPQSSGQSSGETVRPATHVQHSTMIFRDTSTGIFKPTVIATLNPQNLRTKNEKQRQKSTKNVWKNSLHFLFGRSIQHSRCQTPKNPTRGKRSSAKKKSVSDKCRENDTNGFLLPVQWPLYDLLNGGTLKYRPLYCR